MALTRASPILQQPTRGTLVAMFGSGELSDLEPVRQALAQGRYDAAFALLESAVRRRRRRRSRALYRLHLAGLYALYGDDGLEDGSLALRSAVETDPGVTELFLYQALYWEFGALGGESARKVKRGLKGVRSGGDAEALYHAANALYTAGALEESLVYLAQLDEAELPGYLGWRRWSLTGLIEEQLGRLESAAAAFELSVQLALGADQQLERLALAGCLLELHRGEEALAVLDGIDQSQLELEDDVVHMKYLAGRAEFERGNPNRALELLEEARALTSGEGDELYPLLLAEGQVMLGLGRVQEAADLFERSVDNAAEEQLSYALHEWALALMEVGDLESAEERLDEVIADLAYAYRADALADLAEVLFKLGNFDRAEILATQALELGATAAACFTLGSIAYEYFRLDEAVTWFERAASASEPGEPVWVLAQQLLADVFAQKGPQMAERLVTHARAALAYTDPANEWFLPLKGFLETAERELGGNRRVLN
ncbi:MAG: tetratricopeptide repeat protein [Trueperaceae bacterium]